MRFLLDTDTCIHWLRGTAAVRERVTAVGAREMAVSVITLAELRYGAAASARPDANHRAVDGLLGGLAVFGVSPAVARAFGEIKAKLRTRGQLLEDFDVLIAATAVTHGLTLVTNNTAHYGRIPGLRLDNWIA
jgi:tRNA(fMet)-specific endonuclease VapC